MHNDRIRNSSLQHKIMSADDAARFFKTGMVVGMSGFTRAGDCKAMPLALAKRAETDPFHITLLTGASLGDGMDTAMAEALVVQRRMPFQVDPVLRDKINKGQVMFIDQHLSETVELLRSQQIPAMDIAVIEAVAITENGGIVPTTSVGNSASFAILAKQVIVEINLSHPLALEGLHDIYIPTKRPLREPIPITAPESRIGRTSIPVPPEKIVAVVITNQPDSASTVQAPDEDTTAIAGHLIEFFNNEVKHGRLTRSLQPLQVGIGSIANAVMEGFADGAFHNLKIYSEVLQDSTFKLFDTGKLDFASGCSMTLSRAMHDRVMENFDQYKNKLVLRTQEVSNHPEIVRRLGIIAVNTALEFDIYGNVNSTHVDGTHMMNGIGGSGDFARNAFFSVFVTKSLAKDGKISRIVPMASHVDNNEHDVDIVITENGLADLRGLAPRERAVKIISNCAHPLYRDMLHAYFDEACHRGGHTPHLLERAFELHTRYINTGSMLPIIPANKTAAA